MDEVGMADEEEPAVRNEAIPVDVTVDEAPNSKPSILSNGTSLTGEMKSKVAVHILGQFDGRLEAPSITLGSDGRITGNVDCEAIFVEGVFDGDLRCKAASLGRSCTLNGKVVCGTMRVELGAKITGDVTIG